MIIAVVGAKEIGFTVYMNRIKIEQEGRFIYFVKIIKKRFSYCVCDDFKFKSLILELKFKYSTLFHL